MIELGAVSDEVKKYINQLEKTNEANIIQFEKYEKKIVSLERNNQILEEKLKLALLRQFGKAAERFVGKDQLLLFESEEVAFVVDDKESLPETITVPEHKRKKPGRKPLDENIPRVETIVDISEEEKQCACGHDLVCIGEEVSERLQIIPQKVWVERIIKPKYACHHCEGSGDEDKPAVRMAKTPGNIIPGSIASPGLLSFIFTSKYCDHLPYYRQEAGFQRIGVELSRQNMSNWQLQVSKKLAPLFEAMKAHLKTGNVLGMDETTMAVMNEPGRENKQKSYMWLARGGPPDKPLVWYEYRETRSAKQIIPFLEGFRGYLQTDGYEAYDSALKSYPNIIHISCLSHIRRRFFETHKISTTPGLADAALSQIKGLYTIEEQLRKELKEKKISEEEFLFKRKERCTPILAAFHDWLETNSTKILDSSKLGDAISYALGQWPKLINYLLEVQLTPDNNACERAIRPFVIGRRNWVASGSPEGAQSSCELFSLIETAKANKLNPYEYLSTIFERAAGMTSTDDWGQLLPWNLSQ